MRHRPVALGDTLSDGGEGHSLLGVGKYLGFMVDPLVVALRAVNFIWGFRDDKVNRYIIRCWNDTFYCVRISHYDKVGDMILHRCKHTCKCWGDTFKYGHNANCPNNPMHNSFVHIDKRYSRYALPLLLISIYLIILIVALFLTGVL